MKYFALFHLVLLVYIIEDTVSIYIKKVNGILGDDLYQLVFTCDAINEKYLPEIGNGHIATQMKSKHMFMNGIYNGLVIESHRASIPSSINWNVSSTNVLLKRVYSLDSVIGVFHEVLIYDGYNISMSSYVSRVDRQILIRNISLSTLGHSVSVSLRVDGTLFDPNQEDFDFQIYELSDSYFIKGKTKIPENNHTTKLPIFIFLEKVPKEIVLNFSQPWMAFVTSLDSVQSNAFEAFNKALSDKSQLLDNHIQGWLDTWDSGSLFVSGSDPFVRKSVHAAQYYLYSSLPSSQWAITDPSWLFYGLSPTGLAHGNTQNDYLGHVFWDMDTWMFPAVLPFHNLLAIEMIKYRRIMLQSALEISRITGFQGARYPWESARTGYEITYGEIYGKNEIHISSDVSLAVQQLLWMSSKQQRNLYFDLGKDIIFNIARFWRSRLSFNEKSGKYTITNVMPPDEYVQSCNNSAFTNIAAMKSLEAPLMLAKRYNDNITSEISDWFKISKMIEYPLDKTRNLILEYDGYKKGKIVKQADVVLLQFPLQFVAESQCFINNLNYYENVTDVNGPAMTWAIFSINWFDLKKPDKAEYYFKRNFNYITSPFYVWSEIVHGAGAINFMTGIGGYLQNIVYGFMGMRLQFIDDGQLLLDPTITSTINTISMHNVTFQNSNLDIHLFDKTLSIKLLNYHPIFVFVVKDGKKYLLNSSNKELSISCQKVLITSAG